MTVLLVSSASLELPYFIVSLCCDYDSFILSRPEPRHALTPLTNITSVKVIAVKFFLVTGDDGSVQPPECCGIWEAEAARTGEEALPRKPMATGWAGQHPAEAAEERAERSSAGGGEETSGIHERAQKIRWGCITHRKYKSLIKASGILPHYMCMRFLFFLGGVGGVWSNWILN